MKFRALFMIVSLAGISPGHCTNPEACKACPEGWTKWENNCYRFYNQPRLNFEDSEAHCAQFVPSERKCPCQTAHLATVESAAENNFLHEWWKSMREPITDRQYVRIGYTDSSKEGTWKWTDGTPSTSYTGWDSGQPDNAGGGQHCAVMWKTSESSAGDTGRWDDEGCEALRGFIYESCEDGEELVEGDLRWYYNQTGLEAVILRR